MADKSGFALPTHYAPEVSISFHPLTAVRHQHDNLITEILGPLATVSSL